MSSLLFVNSNKDIRKGLLNWATMSVLYRKTDVDPCICTYLLHIKTLEILMKYKLI